jgi:hypothetical protein
MTTQVCKPNISAAGRKRRRLVGYVATAVGLALVVGLALAHTAWWWRAFVFLPATMAAFGFLQATRGTCVAHAAKGTFEHEDFSTTKAEDAEVSASREAAAVIRRDALLVALGCTAIAVATAFVI